MPQGAPTRVRLPLWRKKELLAALDSGVPYRNAEVLCASPGVTLRTLERIKYDKARLLETVTEDTKGRKIQSNNMGHGGLAPAMAFREEILDLCKAIREKGKSLTLLQLKEYIRRAHPQWVAEYIEGREAAHRQARHADALDDLCRDVVRRSNFVY